LLLINKSEIKRFLTVSYITFMMSYNVTKKKKGSDRQAGKDTHTDVEFMLRGPEYVNLLLLLTLE